MTWQVEPAYTHIDHTLDSAIQLRVLVHRDANKQPYKPQPEHA